MELNDKELAKLMKKDAKAYRGSSAKLNRAYSRKKLPDNYWRFVNKLIKM